jgi:hypothetical protein
MAGAFYRSERGNWKICLKIDNLSSQEAEFAKIATKGDAVSA